MKEELLKFKINATVLYDKANPLFRQQSLEEKHELITKYKLFDSEIKDGTETNLFKTKKKDIYTRNPNSPFLMITSTSFTPDEDINILLNALDSIDSKYEDAWPQIELLVTGKGPQKDIIEKRIKNKKYKKIRVQTIWLQIVDYPKMLGSLNRISRFRNLPSLFKLRS